MVKKSRYDCIDGRSYDVSMSWDEKFRESEKVFSVQFAAKDRESARPLKLPREIATYAIGDPEETLGERVKYYYDGDREAMMADWLTTAYRRACDWIERGK
jgi:hypothetical protein